MTDEELAKHVRDAAFALWNAIAKAKESGLAVRIQYVVDPDFPAAAFGTAFPGSVTEIDKAEQRIKIKLWRNL